MPVPDLALRNKVAVITGARRGICRAIALGFAEAGADVAVCDIIDEGELTEVAEAAKRLGRRVVAIKADISKKSDAERIVKTTTDQLGAVDILLNGAAVTRWVSILDMSEEDWDAFIDVDLKGYFLCSQAAARIMMKQKRGNIMNIASTASFKALANRGAYGIAKAGVVMLTKVLALELAQHNIRVNAFAPAMVRTEFARPIWGDPALRKVQEGKTPLGRIADPEDMVGTALFLASDASRYVTGHTVLVDGGFLL